MSNFDKDLIGPNSDIFQPTGIFVVLECQPDHTHSARVVGLYPSLKTAKFMVKDKPYRYIQGPFTIAMDNSIPTLPRYDPLNPFDNFNV